MPLFRTKQKTTKKKSKVREWFNAIMFAVVASTLVRGLLFSAYAIPSGSMEGTLLTGDYLFVSKVSYGARMPFTPVQVPFLESTVTGDSVKTYWEGIKLPYFRLPGFSEIQNGDIVVFNKPEEVHKPVDVRTTLIKRCVAKAGDVISIENGEVRVNGKTAGNPPKRQSSYYVVTDGTDINPRLLRDRNIEILGQVAANSYEMIIPADQLAGMKNFPWIKTIDPVVTAAGTYVPDVFPSDKRFAWNQDNFGPLKIPEKG